MLSTCLQTPGDDVEVAAEDAGIRELELPEPISGGDVYSCVVED